MTDFAHPSRVVLVEIVPYFSWMSDQIARDPQESQLVDSVYVALPYPASLPPWPA